jgi:hypothetical protein
MGWMANVFIAGPLVMYVVISNAPQDPPPLWMFPIDAMKVFLFNNMVFYFMHRSFHIWGYSWHKRHHHWTVLDHPWATFDASLVEHVFINVFPLALGCWIFNVSQIFCALLAFLGTESAMLAHMGVSRFHAYHHANPSFHFGNIDFMGVSIWDTLCGTVRKTAGKI